MHSIHPLPDTGLILVQFAGRMTVADGRAAFLELMARPGFDPEVPILVDMLGVTDLVADFMSILLAVQGVRAQLGRFRPQSRVVALVGGETHYGMARIVEQVVETVSDLRIRVTLTVTEAAAHLGMTETEVSALLAQARALPPKAGAD